MRRFCLLSVALLATAFVVGCGSKGGETPVAENTGSPVAAQNAVATANSPATQPVVSLPANAGPDVVISTFLNATRSGNEATATSLLTLKAREETAKQDLTLDPPGTPSMQYKIAKVDYPEDTKDLAYVNSIWTETQGEVQDSFEVVWVLRRQADGWRIAGMAASTVPEEPPVFLNFEDAADVARIKSQINQGEPSTEPAAAPANTATQPAAPGTTLK